MLSDREGYPLLSACGELLTAVILEMVYYEVGCGVSASVFDEATLCNNSRAGGLPSHASLSSPEDTVQIHC